ncbi:MAG: hypothetical protein ABS882_05755 [Lysinibacillus sp.]
MYVKEFSNQLISEQEDMFVAYMQTYNGNKTVGETTSRFPMHEQPNQIREALMKGYVEMSQLNLSICRECLHAEYEAEHVVERLVSGG